MVENIRQIDQDAIENLRRDYVLAIDGGYEKITFRKLAHSLRLITELKSNFLNGSKFPHHTPTKKTKKLLRSVQNVLVFFSEGVWLEPDTEITFKSPHLGRETSFVTRIKVHENHRKLIGVAVFSGDAPRVKKIRKSIKLEYSRSRELFFEEWLGADIISMGMRSDSGFSPAEINRLFLIKRIANRYGGSHPVTLERSDNRWDKLVDFAMQFQVGEMPIPFLLLMHFSETIFRVANIDVPHPTINKSGLTTNYRHEWT